MKKLCLFFLFLATTSMYALVPKANPVFFKTIRTTSPNGPRPKSPVVAPTIYIDGNVLTFETSCDGCTLQLIDEDGEVAYTTVIPAGTTTLTLPADLTGTYELQIIRGDWMFYGEVEL